MRVFITGASGYIGRHVALELLSRGHQVVGLARRRSERTKYAPEIAWCFGDLSDPASYAAAAEQSDAVIHCAMDYSAAGENADLDRRFVDAMKDFDGHFVYTSNLFGGRVRGAIHESTMTASDHWRFQSEALVLAREGVSSVIRLGFVYGGAGGHFWQILSPGTLSGLKPDDIPNALWPMIHVRDVASLYTSVLESSRQGVFHGYDGTRLTAAEVIAATRAVYESLGATGSESHDYIQGLLEASVETENQRALSTGWIPEHPSFLENAESAYSEAAEP